MRVRPAAANDLGRIKQIAVESGMFPLDEVDFFDEMFEGFLDGSLEGHRWLVAESADGRLVGAAQVAPEPFADRMWNLYFIAVEPGSHRTGIGAALIANVEAALRQLGDTIARTLVVETSSTDQYATARQFYVDLGYDEEARIRDFYGPDDNKVVFWKSLVGQAVGT